MSESVLGSERIEKGRPFQIEGPATAKARFCLVEVRANGTRRRLRSAERRERELRALCVGPQNSTRDAGARPSKQRHTNEAILYSIRCLAGSQCKMSRI